MIMTIVRVNEFTAAEGKSVELFNFLQELMPYISGAEGCLSCEVLKHQEHSDQFMIIERWNSIENHQLAITNYPQEKYASGNEFVWCSAKRQLLYTVILKLVNHTVDEIKDVESNKYV